MKKKFSKQLDGFLLFVAGFALFFLVISQAQAQIPTTDLASIARQVIGYEQQVMGYVRQGLQLQNEIRNLAQNPMSALGSETGSLINSMGQIMSGGKAIGSGMAQIDRNFSQTYKNPMAGKLSDKFTSWHSTNTDTLQGMVKSAGVYMDGSATDTQKIQRLYDESLSTDGQVQAIGKLSQINAMQVEQMQKLGTLLSVQTLAMGNDMAMKTAKDQEVVDLNKNMMMPSRNPRAFFDNTPSKY